MKLSFGIRFRDFQIISKMPTIGVGREDPHVMVEKSPHSGGETHPQMVEKTTQRWRKNPHGMCERKLLLGRVISQCSILMLN